MYGRLLVKIFAHNIAFFRGIGVSNPVESIRIIVGVQMISSFRTLWEWQPSIWPNSGEHLSDISARFCRVANKIKPYC